MCDYTLRIVVRCIFTVTESTRMQSAVSWTSYVCLCVCVGQTTVTELCRASGSVCLKLFTLTMQWCSSSGMIGRRVWGWFYLLHRRCCTSVYKAISNANKTFGWFGWELRHFTQLPTFQMFSCLPPSGVTPSTQGGNILPKNYLTVSADPKHIVKNKLLANL